MKPNNANPTPLKSFKFDTKTEQRTPGTVEAHTKQEALEMIEGGDAEFGDTYYAHTQIDLLTAEEI
ncbi:MAG: hypothetical protein WDZ52_03375 [Pseudohongiellaceae bacterium]